MSKTKDNNIDSKKNNTPSTLEEPSQKAKNFGGTLKRLITYFRPQRFKVFVVLVMAIIVTACSVASPKLLGNATTVLAKGAMSINGSGIGTRVDFNSLMTILFGLAGLYMIITVFEYLQQIIMIEITQKTSHKLRQEINEKLSRLPLKFFDSHPNGEILSRVTNDVDNVSSTLQQGLTQLVTSVCTLIGVVVMMLIISPIMTLIAFLTLPLSLLMTIGVAKFSQKHFKTQQEELGKLNGHVEEMFSGHKIIKAFGLEKKSVQTFNEINEKLYDSGWKAQFFTGLILPMVTFSGNIGYIVISVVGCILVTKNSIEIGDIQAFIMYLKQFTHPLTQAASTIAIIQRSVASAERVFELLDEEEEIPDNSNAPNVGLIEGNVRFENVKFGYKEDSILMENLSIDIKSGHTIAIVGPTGAGKTTLVNLLMRFYEISGGKITVDGLDIKELKRRDLRSIFGMVLQDTWLFNGTIRDNISYGRENATDEDIINAAKAAHADHFIRTLPDGYDTLLNEEASNISQGQKQLLTIARAILADPSILILDEATSSVDTRTEIYIQKAMSALMNGRTSFVIAHRLSTIRDADLILVMKDGSIIEMGNHNELLSQNGFYAELYNSQFSGSELAEEAV